MTTSSTELFGTRAQQAQPGVESRQPDEAPQTDVDVNVTQQPQSPQPGQPGVEVNVTPEPEPAA